MTKLDGLPNKLHKEHIRCKLEYEGKHFFTRFGHEFVITKYVNSTEVYIQFIFSEHCARTTLDCIKKGQTGDPFINYSSGAVRPITFQTKEQEFLGNIFTSNAGDKYKIINYKNSKDIDIQFLSPPYYIKRHCDLKEVKNGAIRNPYHPNKYGGFEGEDKTYSGGYQFKILHTLWHNLLKRVVSENVYIQSGKYRTVAYENCSMCPEWFNYSIFARDYVNKLSQLNPNFQYNLDKDLLYPFYKENTKGAKYYSNETTLLLPVDINRDFLILNPNRKFKNLHIYSSYKELLEIFWKDKFLFYLNNNGISQETYTILENLRIEYLEIIKRNYPEFEKQYNENMALG